MISPPAPHIMIEDGAYFKGSIEIDRSASRQQRNRSRQARVFPNRHGFNRDDSGTRVHVEILDLEHAFCARLPNGAGPPAVQRPKALRRAASGVLPSTLPGCPPNPPTLFQSRCASNSRFQFSGSHEGF